MSVIFRQKELNILFPFYLHSLIISLSKVILPFYVLYFLHIGLNFWQIALIGSARSIASLLFEIPTGAVADTYGRKFSVILGHILSGVTLLFVPFVKNFYFIIFLFVIDALFETLISGADRAWAVDLLKEKKKDNLIDSYFLKTRAFRNIGLVISPIIAAFILSRFNMSLLWTVFGVGTILSSAILFFGKESKNIFYQELDKETQQIVGIKNFKSHIKESLKIILSSKIILLLFLGVFIFYFVDEITSLAWTPFLEKNNIPLPAIGYLFSVIAAIGIVLPFAIEKILYKKKKTDILIFTMSLYAVLLLSLGFLNKSFFIVIIFILFNLSEEIYTPIEEALTNSYINTKNRATILSTKSIIESFSSIAGGPVAGIVIAVFSLKNSIIFSGFLLLFLPFIYFLIKIKEMRTE